MAEFKDQEFLEMIVRSIVGEPDKVTVERTVDEMGVLLTLKLDPSDMGYVIGRRGQTAQAIRTLLKIIGAKNNARVNLKIYEPEDQVRNRQAQAAQAQASAPVATPATDNVEVDTSAVDDLTI